VMVVKELIPKNHLYLLDPHVSFFLPISVLNEQDRIIQASHYLDIGWPLWILLEGLCLEDVFF